MVTNFEKETAELSEDECRLLPLLFKGFERRTKDNPIKARDIVAGMNQLSGTTGVVLTEVRLRKICNFIRVKGMIPLIATSSGYYISDDPDEIKKQVQSLKDRAAAILAGRLGWNNTRNEKELLFDHNTTITEKTVPNLVRYKYELYICFINKT